jgi:regulator of replication initiation timing
MTKGQVYKAEFEKLREIFKDVEEGKRKLVEGLIQDAAFLFAKNYVLRELLNSTGFIKVHPQNKELQKAVPAAKEYRQNLNSYSVIIKTLNSILQKVESDDDDMSEYEGE